MTILLLTNSLQALSETALRYHCVQDSDHEADVTFSAQSRFYEDIQQVNYGGFGDPSDVRTVVTPREEKQLVAHIKNGDHPINVTFAIERIDYAQCNMSGEADFAGHGLVSGYNVSLETGYYYGETQMKYKLIIASDPKSGDLVGGHRVLLCSELH